MHALSLPTARAEIDAARALLDDSDVIDLHLDGYIPERLVGYALHEEHGRFLGGRLFSHVDLPRAKDGGLHAAFWAITTNPFRTARGRLAAFRRNVAGFEAWVDATGGRARLCTTMRDYDAARAAGAHAVFPVVQGCNCLGDETSFRRALGRDFIVSATLVHLISTNHGETSTPVAGFMGPRGLTKQGARVVETMRDERILVDLAHIHPRTFWAALEVHGKDVPLSVTHTGVRAKADVWRNLDDDQIRAVSATGGVTGIIFHEGFLKRKGGPSDVDMVVEHIEHAIDVGGEDHVGIGSDWDGFIVPPTSLRDARGLPVLVAALLRRGHRPERLKKILGGNAVRVLRALRP